MLLHLLRTAHLVFVVLPRKFSVRVIQHNKFNKKKYIILKKKFQEKSEQYFLNIAHRKKLNKQKKSNLEKKLHEKS